MRELKEAAASGDRARTGEELGDLLFTIVNIARFLEIEAEDVLARMIDRFMRRFQYMEAQLGQSDKTIEETSIEEMDFLWEQAKRLEADGKLPA
jgi:uncharacterized protein YabN with tetrapyrrole methylase and pyrophosphatase domain